MAFRWKKIRQRRVFASWRGQLASQQAIGRSQEDLVRMLNDATELGKALEDNVSKYVAPTLTPLTSSTIFAL